MPEYEYIINDKFAPQVTDIKNLSRKKYNGLTVLENKKSITININNVVIYSSVLNYDGMSMVNQIHDEHIPYPEILSFLIEEECKRKEDVVQMKKDQDQMLLDWVFDIKLKETS